MQYVLIFLLIVFVAGVALVLLGGSLGASLTNLLFPQAPHSFLPPVTLPAV